MARKGEAVAREPQEIEFVGDVPPPRVGGEGRWANQLLPLLKKPNVWAKVWTFDNSEQAYKLQSNLHRRQVQIPEPEHVWEFVARGCEVYAIYRGRKRSGQPASVRRAK